ncbi:MAG: acyl-CoA dehydrogenase family protein [Deltaproteobacteria bacterium]|nr:acyl-CoA dehydrogenase family protein [Deltaproteobacteria bacterium]MBW1873135.1 acyl-CoA dehydrogenase family protein [Deltaproteobacteria bacterium]
MVDFALDETQELIIKTAREFGQEVLQPAEVALDRIADPEEVYKSKLFRETLAKAYELGFHKMSLPEEYGGLQLDTQTTGMVWEELGRWGPGFAASLVSAATVPRLITFLAPGNQELIDRFVIPFCQDEKGEHMSAWCSSEPEVGSDGKNYTDKKIRHYTTATRTEKGYKINGAKSDFISNGGIASVYLVFACVDSSQGICGSGAFIIPADAPGVSHGKPLDKIGLRTLNQAAIFFDDVEIDESYVLFPHGEGYPMLHNSIITVGNLGVGYLAVGLMRAALEDALVHSRERIQGGKPIIEHQVIADKLFRTHMAIESARALLWKGSWLSKISFPGDLKTSLAAKVYATDQAVEHTCQMVQVLGGYGISKEYTLEKYTRDAKLLKIMDGTNETLLLKAATLL